MKSLALLLLLAVSFNTYALEPMNDQEMSASTGGVIEPDVAALDLIQNAMERAENGDFREQDQLDVLFAIGDLLNPFNEVLQYTLERVGVQYGDREPIPTPNGEGLSLLLPEYIERVSFRDMRPAGADLDAPTMGTAHFEGIRFSEDAYVFVYDRDDRSTVSEIQLGVD